MTDVELNGLLDTLVTHATTLAATRSHVDTPMMVVSGNSKRCRNVLDINDGLVWRTGNDPQNPDVLQVRRAVQLA